MQIARQEVFGPVLAVITVDDAEHAVRVAADSEYGLAAAVWTRDLGKAHRISRALKVGTVWVNCYEEGDLSVPFGGTKLSGHGLARWRSVCRSRTRCYCRAAATSIPRATARR
jgi:gamma-glutamyl-gamma-aminobutyraldehyde dehydrogenase